MSRRDDGCLSADWDEAAQHAFEQGLRRRRSDHTRAWCCLMQARALLAADDSSRRQAGKALLERVTRDYPDPMFVWQAHELLAELAETDADFELAEAHYRSALRAVAGTGARIEGHVWLRIVRLIIRTQAVDRIDEAAELLAAARSEMRLYSEWFAWEVTAARLAVMAGRDDLAAECARRALRLAAITDSPFPRHPGVGLVHAAPAVLAELRRLAGPDCEP